MPRFSKDIKQCAGRLLDMGINVATIARYLACSVRSVRRWCLNVRLHGHFGSRFVPAAGRRRKLERNDLLALVGWLKRSPMLMLDELAILLAFRRGVVVSLWTIDRTLRRAGYWVLVCSLFKPEQLVFVYESSGHARQLRRP